MLSTTLITLITILERLLANGVQLDWRHQQVTEVCRTLYRDLRLADSKKLANVFVVSPLGYGIAVVICDRLVKSAFVMSTNTKT